MAGRGLTSGVIKGITVCCFTMRLCAVFHCKHTALYGSAMQSSVQWLTEICIVYI
ncbi:unnamed protein product [Staurois parvus]|uniref:Uncharacterized protein n=1 Tax=Staurois parvus TaxID=386267 RepID=A0ABN9BYT6_9NEOB|nr:unnamed protein product [Staurois parvus]